MSQAQGTYTSNIEAVDIIAEPIGSENLKPKTGVLKGNTSATASLKAGTILGKLTSGGLLVPYDNSNSDGSETAIGILSENITPESQYTTASDGSKTARQNAITYYTAGSFFEAELTGIDAAGKAELSECVFV